METLAIKNKIRLIELFAGVGAQAMALRNIGADFEHYLTCEWWVQSVASYKAIHMGDDHTDYSCGYTVNELQGALVAMGISNDGKKPMTPAKIGRKPEKWLRDTYNNIKATKNLVDITKVHGDDLMIDNVDQFTYLLTYSFPCQDLSVAGKMRGMDKGSGTRSGMLWEVERILQELSDAGKPLPQVLLMENVPQVMQKKNMHNFTAWQKFLEGLGYRNYAQLLNAKDYGVAQNRNRAFMVSVLGDFQYTFPEPVKLTKTVADYLEPEVAERYYISPEKAGQHIVNLVESGKMENAPTVQKVGYIDKGTGEHQSNVVYSADGISRCLDATDYKHKPLIIDSSQNSHQ